MTTNLRSIENGVNLLTIQGITIIDLDEVDSWLFAIDMLPKERHEACKQVLADGTFSVCNIEHRVEVRVNRDI